MLQLNATLTEGLQRNDLANFVSETFTIDQYSSKMGEDKDIVVLSFLVKEKGPATDLMEFIEKGYDFILDADMSTGEESNGKYQVFAEIQRTNKISEHILQLLDGIGQLCDCQDWHFKYQKNDRVIEVSRDSINEHVPVSPEAYEQKILEFKRKDLNDFFDQGSVEVMLESDNTLIFSKPYSGSIKSKFIAIGEYNHVKNTIPGKLSLDEGSQGECLFLNKYLGNYDIDKIGDKFLIQNGEQAIIISKERW